MLCKQEQQDYQDQLHKAQQTLLPQVIVCSNRLGLSPVCAELFYCLVQMSDEPQRCAVKANEVWAGLKASAFLLHSPVLLEIPCDDFPLNSRCCSADDVWSAEFTGNISRHFGEV